jgi:hypothetical protein
MNIQTAIAKINVLSLAELEHTLQMIDNEIKMYVQIVVNYPPGRMEKYGNPHLKKLADRRTLFFEKIIEKKKEAKM